MDCILEGIYNKGLNPIFWQNRISQMVVSQRNPIFWQNRISQYLTSATALAHNFFDKLNNTNLL
ncbi:MAG: hypothetical protein DRR19_33150 [Candidatus Parabeggiatoa sp. nov. 1]|nr:MAG: hypothetical protein DRR19_33150 [Gammaproteobacteria bacterium]